MSESACVRLYGHVDLSLCAVLCCVMSCHVRACLYVNVCVHACVVSQDMQIGGILQPSHSVCWQMSGVGGRAGTVGGWGEGYL